MTKALEFTDGVSDEASSKPKCCVSSVRLLAAINARVSRIIL
jgi:hypothetical protein